LPGESVAAGQHGEAVQILQVIIEFQDFLYEADAAEKWVRQAHHLGL
jgi:hypothetical protein